MFIYLLKTVFQPSDCYNQMGMPQITYSQAF